MCSIATQRGPSIDRPILIDWSPELAGAVGHHWRARRWRAGDWPHVNDVRHAGLSWNDLMRLAGHAQTSAGVWRSSPRHQRQLADADDPAIVHTSPWTREEVYAALLADRNRRGRWPTEVDWQHEDPDGLRPTAVHVRWVLDAPLSAAIEALGGRPLRPGEHPDDHARRAQIKRCWPAART